MTSHNSRLRQTRQDTSLKRKPFKKSPMTSHTLLHHETLKQKQILCKKSTLSNGFEPGTFRVWAELSKPKSPHNETSTHIRLNTGGSAPGLHRVAVQSDIGIFFAYFRLFHFLAKNSLTLTPSETECFAHVFSLLDVPLSKTVWPNGLRRWLKAPFRKAFKRIRIWDLQVMSRSQQAQISTQWNFDWHTIEYRGFSTRPAQSCCSIRHRNLLCIFSSFHFLEKNSLTLTPSETQCFAHVFFFVGCTSFQGGLAERS